MYTVVYTTTASNCIYTKSCLCLYLKLHHHASVCVNIHHLDCASKSHHHHRVNTVSVSADSTVLVRMSSRSCQRTSPRMCRHTSSCMPGSIHVMRLESFWPTPPGQQKRYIQQCRALKAHTGLKFRTRRQQKRKQTGPKRARIHALLITPNLRTPAARDRNLIIGRVRVRQTDRPACFS